MGKLKAGMPQRILIIKIGAIGDCLMAHPAASFLRRVFPQAHIAWLVGGWSSAVVEGQCGVDEVIPCQDAVFFRKSVRNLFALFRLVVRLRRKRFDSILLLHRSLSFRLFARAVGAPRRAGLSRAGHAFLTDWEVDAPNRHESERCLAAARRLVPESEARPEVPAFFIPEKHLEEADREWRRLGFKPKEKVVALVPGGGKNPKTEFLLKRWPLENYADLAARLAVSDERVLILGTPEELADFRRGMTVKDGRIRFFAGPLMTVAALLRRCALCLANDSGLMHLAARVGCPVLALFGPTNPAVWGPGGRRDRVLMNPVPCQFCYRDDGVFPPCPYEQRCLKQLSVGRVLDATAAALAGEA